MAILTQPLHFSYSKGGGDVGVWEPGRNGLKFHYLEIGPLNLPESSHMKIVKEAVWNILSLFIPSNWWTGFSSWQDFFGLLRSGTNLPIHTVVMDVNRRLERIESGYCLIDNVSEKRRYIRWFTWKLPKFIKRLPNNCKKGNGSEKWNK